MAAGNESFFCCYENKGLASSNDNAFDRKLQPDILEALYVTADGCLFFDVRKINPLFNVKHTNYNNTSLIRVGVCSCGDKVNRATGCHYYIPMLDVASVLLRKNNRDWEQRLTVLEDMATHALIPGLKEQIKQCQNELVRRIENGRKRFNQPLKKKIWKKFVYGKHLYTVKAECFAKVLGKSKTCTSGGQKRSQEMITSESASSSTSIPTRTKKQRSATQQLPSFIDLVEQEEEKETESNEDVGGIGEIANDLEKEQTPTSTSQQHSKQDQQSGTANYLFVPSARALNHQL